MAAGSSRRRNALLGETSVDVDGTSVTGKAFVFAEIEKSRADNWLKEDGVGLQDILDPCHSGLLCWRS